jgi:hypothetical protein
MIQDPTPLAVPPTNVKSGEDIAARTTASASEVSSYSITVLLTTRIFIFQNMLMLEYVKK